jgi:hypothetical protein
MFLLSIFLKSGLVLGPKDPESFFGVLAGRSRQECRGIQSDARLPFHHRMRQGKPSRNEAVKAWFRRLRAGASGGRSHNMPFTIVRQLRRKAFFKPSLDSARGPSVSGRTTLYLRPSFRSPSPETSGGRPSAPARTRSSATLSLQERSVFDLRATLFHSASTKPHAVGFR